MSQKPSHDSAQSATSLGHSLGEASYLDDHFAASQPEYEALLRYVGLEAGWHVLDAGCGGGSYLPLLSELVGPTGRISAIDLAPENITVVQKNVGLGTYSCPVDVQMLSILQLPFPDDSFDAVWCANVSQYLTDDEFRQALNEFHRVVRPGGLVAIKDWDLNAFQIQPAPLSLVWHLVNSPASITRVQLAGTLRPIAFPKWFREAGLTDIRLKTELMEKTLPLRDVERRFISAAITYFASQAKIVGVPPEDLDLWNRLSDTESATHICLQPDCYWREAQIVVTGRVQ